jgi:2-polyprenyl-3-methyl-5-hydroxy-6-metoxy-1,4-benzoquinol methylase
MINKVSIIIPVIRPKNIPVLLSTITKNSGVKRSSYEVITMEDVTHIGAPKMVKKLVELAEHDLVMFLGDDTLPQKNFLRNALRSMAVFTNMDGMVGLNDPNRKPNEAPTHWLASKKILPLLDGEFFHTGYIHQYCDNELAARCMMMNKYVYSETSVIKHMHPGFNKGEETFTEKVMKHGDEHYKRVYGKETETHDSKLFKQRMKKLNMIFSTGERVVIGGMKHDIVTLQEHIARYNFAMKYCIHKKVLDAACGTGYGTNLLAEAALSTDGWDISEDSVNFAKSKYPQTFEVHDLSKKLPNIRYNTIVSFETIEHLKDPSNFLKWVRDHCDTFVFSVPLNNPSKYHLNTYTLDSLESMILRYWSDIEWLNQEYIYVNQGVNPKSTFAIGICLAKNLTTRKK